MTTYKSRTQIGATSTVERGMPEILTGDVDPTAPKVTVYYDVALGVKEAATEGPIRASDVAYSNDTSELAADDVQEAIDELAADVDAITVLPATETQAGIAEIATQVETDAGSDDSTIVTPAKLKPYADRITAGEVHDGEQDTIISMNSASIAALQTATTALGDADIALDARLDVIEGDYLTDAPSDGQQYARLDAGWSIVGAVSVPDAAEDMKGIAEIATQTETNTGTDDARILTPAKLKNFTGSIAGLTLASGAFASQTEVNAGAITDKAVSPATLRNLEGWIAGPLGVGDAISVADVRLQVKGTLMQVARIETTTSGSTGNSILDFVTPGRFWRLWNDGNTNRIVFRDVTAGADRLSIDTAGLMTVGGAATFNAAVTVNSNVSMPGGHNITMLSSSTAHGPQLEMLNEVNDGTPSNVNFRKARGATGNVLNNDPVGRISYYYMMSGAYVLGAYNNALVRVASATVPEIEHIWYNLHGSLTLTERMRLGKGLMLGTNADPGAGALSATGSVYAGGYFSGGKQVISTVGAWMTVSSPTTAYYVLDSNDTFSNTQIQFKRNNINRWIVFVTGAESSGNAGSNLYIRRYDDGGTNLGEVMRFYRDDGAVDIPGYIATGLRFGSQTVTNTYDLSKHLALYSTSYGLSVTSGNLNVVGGAVQMVCGNVVQAQFSTGGLYIAEQLGIGVAPNSGIAVYVSGTGVQKMRITTSQAGQQAGIELFTVERNFYLWSTGGAFYIRDLTAPANRFFVDSTGNVGTGSFSTTGATNGKQTDPSQQCTFSSRTGTASSAHHAFYNANGQVGSITTSASASQYNTSSDKRRKKNFRPFDAGSYIDRLEFGEFEWIIDNRRGFGVLAQDMVGVFPEAITVGTEENGDVWSADYAKYVPLAMSELKTLRARVAELEAKHVH